MLALIALVPILSCHKSTEPIYIPTVKKLPAIDVPWDSLNSIVCFGTSLTYGLIWDNDIVGFPKSNISDQMRLIRDKNSLFYHQADSAYPYCLGNKLRIKVHNRGQVGATTERALQIVHDSVLSANPALVLLEFSANDFLRELDVNETRERMDSLITILKTFGSQVVLTSFVDEFTISDPPKDHHLYEKRNLAMAYFQMLQELATAHQILFIKDCFLGIFGNESYMQDGIHPNEIGYKRMAENVTFALENTLIKNNLFKNKR